MRWSNRSKLGPCHLQPRRRRIGRSDIWKYGASMYRPKRINRMNRIHRMRIRHPVHPVCKLSPCSGDCETHLAKSPDTPSPVHRHSHSDCQLRAGAHPFDGRSSLSSATCWSCADTGLGESGDNHEECFGLASLSAGTGTPSSSGRPSRCPPRPGGAGRRGRWRCGTWRFASRPSWGRETRRRGRSW